jgi:hypothetical protein
MLGDQVEFDVVPRSNIGVAEDGIIKVADV